MINLEKVKEIGNLTLKDYGEALNSLESDMLNSKDQSQKNDIEAEMDDLLYYRCATDIELYCVTFFPEW